MKTIINLNEVYTAPTFEVCEVAVEEGFAATNGSPASTQTEYTSWESEQEL